MSFDINEIKKYLKDPTEFCKYLCELNNTEFEYGYSSIINDMVNNVELDINSPELSLTFPILAFIIWKCLFCYHRVITLSSKKANYKKLMSELLASLPEDFIKTVGTTTMYEENKILFSNHSNIVFRDYDAIDNCGFCLDYSFILDIDNPEEIKPLIDSIRKCVSSHHHIVKMYKMDISHA